MKMIANKRKSVKYIYEVMDMKDDEVKLLYENNEDVKRYIDDYARAVQVPVKVAFKHLQPRLYIEWMKEKGKI